MKNSTWRKVGYFCIYITGILFGIIIGQLILLNFVSHTIVNLFQLTPEQSADFYNKFYQSIRGIVKLG
jgi:hypothetical protein